MTPEIETRVKTMLRMLGERVDIQGSLSRFGNEELAWTEVGIALNSEQRAMVVNLAKANLNERLERLQEELKTL